MDQDDRSDNAYDAIAEDEREQAIAERIAAALERIASVMEKAFTEMTKD